LLFRASAAAVAAEHLAGTLNLRLVEEFTHLHGHRPSPSEVRSWERSLPALLQAVNDAGLGQVEVLVEYALPLNSRRADAVLAGEHPETGEPCAVCRGWRWAGRVPW
jgi:hypothetical protein